MYVFDDFFNPLSTRCGEYTPHENTFLHSKRETTSGWNWKVI